MIVNSDNSDNSEDEFFKHFCTNKVQSCRNVFCSRALVSLPILGFNFCVSFLDLYIGGGLEPEV